MMDLGIERCLDPFFYQTDKGGFLLKLNSSFRMIQSDEFKIYRSESLKPTLSAENQFM